MNFVDPTNGCSQGWCVNEAIGRECEARDHETSANACVPRRYATARSRHWATSNRSSKPGAQKYVSVSSSSPLYLSDARRMAVDSDFAGGLRRSKSTFARESQDLLTKVNATKAGRPAFPAPLPETRTDQLSALPVLRVACRRHARPGSPHGSAPEVHPSPGPPAWPPRT